MQNVRVGFRCSLDYTPLDCLRQLSKHGAALATVLEQAEDLEQLIKLVALEFPNSVPTLDVPERTEVASLVDDELEIVLHPRGYITLQHYWQPITGPQFFILLDKEA